jgi:hypothetical protein
MDPRHEIFRAASDYFDASARYWTAARRGGHMETPTQELVGRSVFYHQALIGYLALPDADLEFAHRRLRYLRRHLQQTSARYAKDRRLPGQV